MSLSGSYSLLLQIIFYGAVLSKSLAANSSSVYGTSSATHRNTVTASLNNNLIEFLTNRTRYPTSGSCDYKEAFKTWLSNCSQQDPDFNSNILESVSNFRVDNPHFGPDCRVKGQCGPTAHPRNVTSRHFQKHYLNRLTLVIWQERCQQYFNAEDLFKEADVDTNQQLTSQQFNEILASTGNRLLKGECIQSSDQRDKEETYPNEYLDAIFERYSNGTDYVNEDGIRLLLEDVGLDERESGQASTSIQEPLKELHKRATQGYAHRRLITGYFASNATDLNLCLKSHEVLIYFDSDNSSTLIKDEFLQMLAYIVYQISDGNTCAEDKGDNRNFNAAQAYGYGTMCVFVISACSALGFLIIPLLPASIYENMMACFIALAFGTLTGDAVLHMLPEALATEEDSDSDTVSPTFYKCLVITLSIYGLFVFEALTQLLTSGHSHEGSQGGNEHHGHSHVVEISVVKNLSNIQEIGVGGADYQQQFEEEGTGSNQLSSDNTEPTIKNMVSGQDQITACFGMTTLALVIILGDAIHNVTDGIAIGASFATSTGEGFSTALAVLFHELPHEFGDFVILLMTGMSLKRALVWNFLTSLTAFIGLYIGILVGANEAANQWIFAVTAGMFLYVAVADMLPELRNMKVKNRWQAFIAQNVGALIGIGFMVFMYFLEDLINF